MEPGKRIPVACVYVLLLLSTHPINAARKYELLDVDHDDILEQSVAVQTRDALANNISSHAAWFGKLEGTCNGLKEGFERRAEKVRLRIESAGKDELDLKDLTYVALKTHKVMKTFAKAEKRDCKWVNGGDFNRTAFDKVASLGVLKKCKEQANQILEAASTGSTEVQTAALKKAVAVMMSRNDDCTYEETGEEVVEKDEASVDNAAQELQTISGASLVQLNSIEKFSSGIIILFAWPILVVFGIIALVCAFWAVVGIWWVLRYIIKCLIWTGIKKLVDIIKGRNSKDDAKGYWRDVNKCRYSL